eukprot:g5873.t1
MGTLADAGFFAPGTTDPDSHDFYNNRPNYGVPAFSGITIGFVNGAPQPNVYSPFPANTTTTAAPPEGGGGRRKTSISSSSQAHQLPGRTIGAAPPQRTATVAQHRLQEINRFPPPPPAPRVLTTATTAAPSDTSSISMGLTNYPCANDRGTAMRALFGDFFADCRTAATSVLREEPVNTPDFLLDNTDRYDETRWPISALSPFNQKSGQSAEITTAEIVCLVFAIVFLLAVLALAFRRVFQPKFPEEKESFRFFGAHTALLLLFALLLSFVGLFFSASLYAVGDEVLANLVEERLNATAITFGGGDESERPSNAVAAAEQGQWGVTSVLVWLLILMNLSLLRYVLLFFPQLDLVTRVFLRTLRPLFFGCFL